MIRYALRCAEAHTFDSWFASADAFDALRASKRLACPECGSSDVEKSLMAPRVGGTGAEPEPDASTPSAPAPAPHPLERLRREVEAKSTYVGAGFVREVRAQHDGEAPNRSVHGEATPGEARQLLADGIPVVPLPFVPKARAN